MMPRLLLSSALLAASACTYDDSYYPDAAIPVLPSEEALLAARPFLLEIPTAYDGGAALPLMVALHGYGDNNKNFVQRLSLKDLANRRGIFIAVPNGTADSQGFLSWHPSPVHYPSWDEEYLAAVIHQVKGRFLIDPARVFSFGYSQGAHMSHRLGCDDSADVVALASLAGQAYTTPSQCAPQKPVSAVELHGTEDAVIGYYGDTQHDPPDPSVPTAHQTIGVWARNDGCTGKLTPTGETLDLSQDIDGAETVVEAYLGCPAGVGVELWTMNGVSHWPDPQPEFMDRVVDFLTQHPRPAP